MRRILPLVITLVLLAPSVSSRADDEAGAASQLTARLLELADNYRKASGEAQAAIQSELITLAKERKQALLVLAKEKPSAFLATRLITKEERSSLPAEVQGELEEEGVFEGWLGVMIADDFEHGRSWAMYSLHDNLEQGQGHTFSLYFADGSGLQVMSGGKFRVKGVRVGNAIVAASVKDLEFIPGEEAVRGKPKSYWLKQVGTKDAALLAQTIEALGGLGWGSTPEIIGILVKALKDPDEDVRIKAAAAFQSSFANRELAVPALREAVKDKSELVRIYAALALVQNVQNPKSEAKEAAPVLLRALSHEDEWIRDNSFRELGSVGYPKAALPHLLKHLESNMGWESSLAARGIAALGRDARPAIPALRKALMERHVAAAGDALCDIDPKGTIPLAITALQHEKLRVWALGALRYFGPAAKHSEDAVRRYLEDPDENVRRLAAEALAAISAEAR